MSEDPQGAIHEGEKTTFDAKSFFSDGSVKAIVGQPKKLATRIS